MKNFAFILASLFVASPAASQTATRYDLDCKHKSAFVIIGDNYREIVSDPVRISVDLTAKLWCSRIEDMSCGTTSPLTVNSTSIIFNHALSLDRRTGILTRGTERSRYSSVAEFTCKKVGFTPLPAIKF